MRTQRNKGAGAEVIGLGPGVRCPGRPWDGPAPADDLFLFFRVVARGGLGREEHHRLAAAVCGLAVARGAWAPQRGPCMARGQRADVWGCAASKVWTARRLAHSDAD